MSTQNQNLPNIPDKDVQGLKPFRHFCMSLGVIPSSYLEALTNEELILWFCDFLQNKVIPTVNNNAECVQELQDLYTELRNYVNNYFTNLDVQEEINNKLNSLISSGTLENILNNKIFNNLNNKLIENSQNIQNLINKNKNFISKNQTNSITMDMLSNEIKTAITGGSTPVVGENSINNFNIQNNSIDFLNLNDILISSKAYNIKYTDFSTLPKYSGGVYLSSSNKLQTNSNDLNFIHYKIPLDYNNIYKIFGYNFGNYVGFIIVDENDNVLDSSINGVGEVSDPATYNNKSISKLFRANENYKYVYMNFPVNRANNTLQFFYTELGKIKSLENIFNYPNYSKLINPLLHLDNKYIYATDKGNFPSINNLNNFNIDVFEMKKGFKYHIEGTDFAEMSRITTFR